MRIFSTTLAIGMLTLVCTVLAQSVPPATIELAGTVRDFKELSVSGGHPDFEVYPSRGFGHYCQNVSTQLGADGLPVFTGQGKKVRWQCTNSSWQPICWALYDPELGDHAIDYRGSSTGGISSPESFNQWFRDVPGVNISIPISLTLVRQQDGSYVFDDNEDPAYRSLGGFFPIEGQGFGNSGGWPDHNFHFTFEMHTEFTYQGSGSQYFKFIGDDDVWVFINGQLVIDLGGIHAAVEQFVDLTRLGLTDGETYSLDFFFAERHRTQSNFRFQTNLLLEDASTPGNANLYD